MSFSLSSLPCISLCFPSCVGITQSAGCRPSLPGRKIFSGIPRLYFFGLAVTDSDWLHFSPMIFCDPITVHQGMWYCDWLWVMGSHAHWSGNNWYSQQGLMEWGMSSSKESEEGKWEHLLGKKQKQKQKNWPLKAPMCAVLSCSVTSNRLSETLWTVAHQATLSMGLRSGKNIGIGCHFLLQGIYPTQGLNPCLLCCLYCRQILYHWAIREAEYY